MRDSNWVDELFVILDIPASKQEWQQKYQQTLDSLTNEVQFVISTLNNNPQQLEDEATKRATTYFLNGHRELINSQSKVLASELLLQNRQPELALFVLQPVDMAANAEYFINLGRALMQLGIFDQSKHCFINALDKEPTSPEPLFHLGFHAGLNGELESSGAYYQECLELSPTHLGALLNLAYLNYQMESFDAAITLASQALEIDKKRVNGYLITCSCLNAQNKFSESYQCAQKARRHCTGDLTEINQLEAVACFELKQYPRVIDLVTEYLAVRPNAIDLKYMRARSYYQVGDLSKAILDIDDLLNLEPYETELLEIKFAILFAQQRWEEAEIAYIRLTESAPQMKFKYQQEYVQLRRNLAIAIG